MADATTLKRRAFIAGGATLAAGLVVGFYLRDKRMGSAPLGKDEGTLFEGYLRIGADDSVTVLSAHMDMGQGIYTGIASLVADELDADWAQMRAEGAAGNTELYGNLAWGGAVQGTGGSTGMASSFTRYRHAGAIARHMLEQAAAAEWGVPAKEIEIEAGIVKHRSGKSARFGELAPRAAAMAVPTLVAFKEPHEWKFIGKESLRRLDTADKTAGKQEYTIDVRLPGMLTAVIAHPPLFGATVISFDAKAAKKIKGVVDVVRIPRGVAVVAENTWAAIKGREKLTVEWDDSAAEKRGSDALFVEYRRLVREGKARIARLNGDVAEGLARAVKTVEASYEFPYLAHAALEPLDAVAWKRGNKLEIWGGHQLPDAYQSLAASVAGIAREDVILHVMMTGGGFGRRAVADGDIVVEAVATAKAIGWKAPVKVMWTREDDMAGGRYRPMYVHALKAGLDRRGRLVAWRHRIVGQSILRGTSFEGDSGMAGVDPTTVGGAVNLPYGVPDMLVDVVATDVGVPVLWWRAVGGTHNAYATEVFVDELAHAAGKDPLFYRLDMLNESPRHLAVLVQARDVSGWGKKLPKGWGRGVAVAESFGTVVAQIAEVRVLDGRIKVERVVCVVDCGLAVNPDIVKAQMEGAIGFGLGAILKGAITLDEGRVVERNFDRHPVLSIDEMPRVEVHIRPSKRAPSGVGEPGVPPIGPAVANAVFAATGKRVRVLPMSKTDFSS